MAERRFQLINKAYRDNETLCFGDDDDFCLSFDGTDFDFTPTAGVRHISFDAADVMTGDIQLTPDVHLINSSKLRLRGNVSTEHMEMYNDGSNNFHMVGTNTANLIFTGITNLVAGSTNADFDAITGTSYGGITEANLLDKTTAETITAAWDFNSTIDVRAHVNIDGSGEALVQFEDEGAPTDEKIWKIRHAGGQLQIQAFTDAGVFGSNAILINRSGTTLDDIVFGTSLRIPAGAGIGSSAVSAIGFSIHNLALADDATGTITTGSHALVMVVSNFNRTAQIASFITTQQTPIHLMTLGAAASYGNSTNPDVDGDANYWKSSNTVLSIKNRLGSTRNFIAYVWNAT